MSIKIGNIEVYDIQELCKTFQVDEPTLMECIENGSLKGRKLGDKWYVSSRVLEDFFERDYDEVYEHKTANIPKTIKELNLSVLTSKILQGEHIETLEDLCKWSPKELLALKGFTKTHLREVECVLKNYGFSPTPKLSDKLYLSRLPLTTKMLQREHIETFEELCKRSRGELLALKGFDESRLSLIESELKNYGLNLRKD